MANQSNETAPDQAETQHVGIADKLAFSIPEAMGVSGTGKTKLYEEIRAGRLVARKMGDKTIILRPDLLAWLNSLPCGVAPQKPWLQKKKPDRHSIPQETTA